MRESHCVVDGRESHCAVGGRADAQVGEVHVQGLLGVLGAVRLDVRGVVQLALWGMVWRAVQGAEGAR